MMDLESAVQKQSASHPRRQQVVHKGGAPRPGNANPTSNAVAAEEAADVRPGMNEYMRIRSNSVGSTRGAFTAGNSAKPPAQTPPRHEKSHDPPVNSFTMAAKSKGVQIQNKVVQELQAATPGAQPRGHPPSPNTQTQTLTQGKKEQGRPLTNRPGLKYARKDSNRGTFQHTVLDKDPTLLSNSNVWNPEPPSPAPMQNGRGFTFIAQPSDSSLQYSEANYVSRDSSFCSPETRMHELGGPKSTVQGGYGSTSLAGSKMSASDRVYFPESYNLAPTGHQHNPHGMGTLTDSQVTPQVPYGHPSVYEGYRQDGALGVYESQAGPHPFHADSHPLNPEFYKEQEYRNQPQKGLDSPVNRFWASITSYFTIKIEDYFYAPAEEIGTIMSIIRNVVYDPTNPEFTSLQQFTWSVLIGIFFGISTALWGQTIERLVEFIWKDIPEQLLEWGIFTGLDGPRPLPHYMWVCPAIFGGFLAWVTSMLPLKIPGQNEWIEALHRQGVMDPSAFWYILVLSTMSMMSGLSLGPELPLVLLSGMAGSWLATLTHQSVLSARVMVLTAGSAAVGGFFGFPMAGALFVLEIPHRMGLQYFEALSPATMSSIISVIFNRMVTGNDVKGYFDYPFLAASLKSHIFYIAVFYGAVGAFVGIVYVKGLLYFKNWTHNWFHASHEAHPPAAAHTTAPEAAQSHSETLPLVGGDHVHEVKSEDKTNFILGIISRISSASISHEPTRATVVGVLAGIVVGTVCMFLPHNLFWGEAQLQTLIDKGRTPLPVFGRDGEPTEILTAWGYCMVDPEDLFAIRHGPGLKCSFLLTVSKIFVIGVSLGTGIVGGHFWGPLYVGAAASNLFVDIMNVVQAELGVGEILYEYPCVALLCIMGAAHVVTYRAHTAIMLILTLTISAFKEDGGSNFAVGDYSAVFPLLVVSCFVSLMLSRDTIFYKQQRCRGDILASPEVLCEPGKDGEPMMPLIKDDEYYNDIYTDDGSEEMKPVGMDEASLGSLSADSQNSVVVAVASHPLKTLHSDLTSEDIERQFAIIQLSGELNGSAIPSAAQSNLSAYISPDLFPGYSHHDNAIVGSNSASNPSMYYNDDSPPTVTSKRQGAAESPNTSTDSGAPPRAPSPGKFEELLARSVVTSMKSKSDRRKPTNHRRIMSGSDALVYASSNSEGGHRDRASSVDRSQRAAGDDGSFSSGGQLSTNNSRSGGGVSNGGARERSGSRDGSRGGTPTSALVAVKAQGSIQDFQPDLLTQARIRSSSVSRMVPKPDRMHLRRKSQEFQNGVQAATGGSRSITDDDTGALSTDAIERSFSHMQHQSNLENDSIKVYNNHYNGNGRNSAQVRGGTSD